MTTYRLISGYGLRATRALLALLLVMVCTIGLLMLFGLPPARPATSEATGRVITTAPGFQDVTLTERLPSFQVPHAVCNRITWEGFDRAARIAFGAAIFQDSQTQLTKPGRHIELAAYLLGPLVLALAVLATVSRDKRIGLSIGQIGISTGLKTRQFSLIPLGVMDDQTPVILPGTAREPRGDAMGSASSVIWKPPPAKASRHSA